MDLTKEIGELASHFVACHKTLSAMGDETRQHIILEMMHMDYHGSRVPEIAGKERKPFIILIRIWNPSRA